MENNEISIEEIFKDENEAIKWLKSIDEPIFKNIFNTLYVYAQKCLRELGEKDLREGIDELSEKDKTEIIDRVKKYITSKEDFRQKCLIENPNDVIETDEEEFKLGIFTKEEMELIQTLTAEDLKEIVLQGTEQDDNRKELFAKIRKANRFYNMKIKLGHTARIVRVAEEVLKQFKGNVNPYLKDMVMISSLLHDIGRFYQAKELDDFNDKKLAIEVEKEKTLTGHSKAGYYYAIMDLYRMNFLSNVVDKELLTKLATGFVVSYHSEANYELEDAKVTVEEKNLLEEFEQDSLNKLIKDIYSNAEYIKFSEDEIGQKKFIEKFFREIMLEKGFESIEALQIDEERTKQIVESVAKQLEKGFIQKTNLSLKDYNKNEQTENQDKSIEEISNELKKVISKGANIEFDESDIKNTLINMAKFDVAKSIYEMFRKVENIEEKRLMQTMFAFPTNIVTDADKIDILNQLAIGEYNFRDTYNPTEYNVYKWNKKGELIVSKIIQSSQTKGTAESSEIKEIAECKKREDAFKFFGTEPEKEIIILKSDKENFSKYNGLKRDGNISSVRSTLWLINQFIFTNMRNKTSIDIIRDSQFIEKAYEQFGQEERIQEILKPYMAYTLFFMDYASDKEYNLLSKDVMEDLCKEADSIYKENDMLREEYELLFDGDLMQNREKFLEERNNQKSKVIKTMQIGKATIDVPVTAKVEAEKVEKENTKDNVREGEEVGDDN